jgi:hypothetical protein
MAEQVLVILQNDSNSRVMIVAILVNRVMVDTVKWPGSAIANSDIVVIATPR